MKDLSKWFNYSFPFSLSTLAAAYHSPAFAYASCLGLAIVFSKEYLDTQRETKSVKTDEVLRHKVEQMEAALSAMVSREKARGW